MMTKKILLVFYFFAAFVLAPNAEAKNETFTVGAVVFELKERENNCVLSYKQGGRVRELKLDLPAPCRVSRQTREKIVSYRYRDIGATVAGIIGSVNESYPEQKKECGSGFQTVLVKKRTVVLGKKKAGKYCLPDAPDEKDFWLLSH